MPKVTCPHCDEELEVSDKSLGSKVKCSVCGKDFVAEEDEAEGGMTPQTAWAIATGLIILGIAMIVAVAMVVKSKNDARREAETESAREVAKAKTEAEATSKDKASKDKTKAVTPSDSDRRALPPTIDNNKNQDAKDAAVGTLLGFSLIYTCACCGTPLAYFILSICLAVWVVKDSRNRSVENGVIWMVLIFFFNIIGLLIYLASRPNGVLVECNNCGNSRLEHVRICPHCHRR